jgi:hypothetical protein
VHYFQTKEENGVLKPVLSAKLTELGIGGFCLRMSCQLSRSSTATTGVWLKYTQLVFPERKETILKTHIAAKNPAWPGLKIMEGDMAVLPRPSEAGSAPSCPFYGQAHPLTSFQSYQPGKK